MDVQVTKPTPTTPVHPDLAAAIGQEFVDENGGVTAAIGQLVLVLVDAGLVEWGQIP